MYSVDSVSKQQKENILERSMSVLNDDILEDNNKRQDDELCEIISKKYKVKQYDSDIGVKKDKKDDAKDNKINNSKNSNKLKRSNAAVIKPKNKVKSPNSHKRMLNYQKDSLNLNDREINNSLTVDFLPLSPREDIVPKKSMSEDNKIYSNDKKSQEEVE